MGLSYDLISEFVKITNDKKDDKKEGTVYATVVSGTEGKYVRIDGSDLLTPMDTTTDIEDGERVTLMIKDHKAIVTGNVTTPSASTSKVDKVTESINSVSDRVGTFELVVADKVSTNELEAYKATIEVLIANKATIEDLTATNAKIENLEVKNAEIENLVVEKATIKDLEAVNATIENLKVKDAEIENAVVENLKATTADIKILNADFAQIKTLVNGNLTSDNILSFNLTSGKVTVDDAFIKDAMIDTISAGKINAGEINTNLVSIGSEDGGMLITGSTQQFTDKNGNVRIQIGKDASGDFTFILYGEDGQGQIINQNGITASAISDGLIVNDMVSDHAAISGGKLDISSVITEINSDNSTTIKSSKIYLNEQAQSLEVAFNSLKTKVDTIQDVTIQGDLTAIVEQVQSNTSKIEANMNSINTLISEDTVIKKQVTDLQGTLNETETTLNSKYTSLSQNLNGFKTTVADTYATKKSVTDVVDNISANYSTTSVMNSAIKQKAQEISASVSSTYATKNQVSTLDNNLKTNYSTTKQMESAINIAKEEINLGVSSIYETKTNVNSKIDAINVGGRNYIRDYMFEKADIWKRENSLASIDTNNKYGCLSETTGSTWLYQELPMGIFKKGQTITVQYEIKCEGVSANSGTNTFLVRSRLTAYKNNVNAGDLCILTEHESQVDTLTSWTKVTATGIIGTIGDSNSLRFRLHARNFKGKIYFRNVKLELGNKATDLSPAPEDIDSNINIAKSEAIKSANDTLTSTISNYYTKDQTDSQINIAKEAIDLSVSTTYETKENVESKVSSTLSSANSYADTKKSEAISTASTDATNKINNAKQELNSSINKKANSSDVYKKSEVYTKSQTDSQINIAKEAIDLSVSTTYETKENVESKVTSTLSSANSYADTKKSEAISTASKDATNKINNAKQELNSAIGKKANSSDVYKKSEVYTKSQTDSQINIAKEAIDLSVSTTYETKENVESKVSSTLSSANSYADTKKSEAISTASTDATNKINNAKQELNSSINKKANSSDVYKKSEVYTKSQTDSQINIAKEEINLGVSSIYETKTNVNSKINAINVGGRNYIRDYMFEKADIWKCENSLASIDTNNKYGCLSETTSKTWLYQELPMDIYKKGQIITVQYEIKCKGVSANSGTETLKIQSRVSAYNNDTNLGDSCVLSTHEGQVDTLTSWTKVTATGVIGTIGDSNSLRFRLFARNFKGKIYFRNVKLELGNKATDLSPAPEDIDSNFTELEYETKTLKQSLTSLQLDSDSINASVKSLEETMINTTNGLANDISMVQDQVNLAMTSSDVQIEIQKQLSNGVNRVTTSTGFIFDDTGLNISKSDSEMKTQITEDGMRIYKNDEVMLTANNQGVDAKNLHATTYLIIGGNSRMEDFIENESKRTAVFWIG